MKIDAIVWQAGKDLQGIEDGQQYAETPSEDIVGTFMSAPAILGTDWVVATKSVRAAITRIQNRCDTDAARWLLSNVGNWLSSTMEGNGAASWLNDYKQHAQAALQTEKEICDYYVPITLYYAYEAAPINPAQERMEEAEKAANAWTQELVAIQTAQTALGTLCGLLRDLQEWTAIQSTAPQSTRTPPQEEGAQLPTIMGTQREEDYYRRAIECKYMERRGDGYRWLFKYQERWVYFLRLCYKNSDLQDADFKKQACRLFGFHAQPNKPLRYINKTYNNSPSGEPTWKTQMDRNFASLEPYKIE